MEQLSKETILMGNELDLYSDGNDLGCDVKDYIFRVHKSMDIYAKQLAIGFNNWMEKENTIWRNEKEEPLTDEELYEMYLQSLNK